MYASSPVASSRACSWAISVNFGFEPVVLSAQSPVVIFVMHRAWMA